jgi:ribosome biogenesis GTPase
VVAVDRGRYACRVGDATVTAMKARELGRRAVVVGDRVSIVGDISGGDDALARVVRVHERVSTLRRTADDTDPHERIIVANADQLVVVTSLADPAPRRRLIDRCLVAAYDAGMTPLLCLTKADLAAPDDLIAAYRALDVPYVVTTRGAISGMYAERSPTTSACSWGTPASASQLSSTGWSRKRCAPPAS